MAGKKNSPDKEGVPFTVLLLWIFGGVSFALIVYLFTPFTHNLDDIKVTLQYVLAPIVWALFAVALLQGHIRRFHPAILLSVSGFFLVFLLSTILGRFPWRAWHDLGFHLTIASCFIVVLGTATTVERFRNISLFYFVIGCGTVVFGLFHFFGGVGALFNQIYPTARPPNNQYTPLFTLLFTLRKTNDMLSTILNRDFYPAYLLMIVPLGIAMAIDYKDVWAKTFFLMFFFLMCVCIMLAFSKDTYLALFIMAVVFGVLYAKEHDWRLVQRPLMIVWAIGGLILFFTVLFAVREKFQDLAWENKLSINNRGIIWGGALGIFTDATWLTHGAPPSTGSVVKHVLIGGGPGAYYLAFPLYRSPNYHLWEISNVTLFAHNQYLDLLCEEGLLGLGTFLFFLGAIAVLLLREVRQKHEHPLNPYQIALFTSLVGISFQNIFSPGIRWTVCGFNYWFLLGLSAAAFHLTLSKRQLARIDAFYAGFSPQLKRSLCVAFLVFTLVFEAVSIPYGLARFNAAKENNNGLIVLGDFSNSCDRILENPKYSNDKDYRAKARSMGLACVEYFKRALRWKPAFITSYYKLAHVYSRLANVSSGEGENAKWWVRAKETYDQLREYAPDYSEIHFNYGILAWYFYLAVRDPSARDPVQLAAALKSFRRAAEMSNKLVVQARFHEVIVGSRDELLKVSSEEARAHHVREIEKVLNDEEFVPADERHAEIRQRLPDLRRLISNEEYIKAVFLEAELLDEIAVKVAEHILTLTNFEGSKGDVVVRDARIAVVKDYYRKRKYVEMLPTLERFLELDDTSTTPLMLYSTAAIRSGEAKRCLEFLGRLVERNPLNWAARWSARKVLQDGARDYESALVQIAALFEILDPEKNVVPKSRLERVFITLPQLHYAAGEAYEKLAEEKRDNNSEYIGLLDKAYKSFAEAIKLDPEGEWDKRAKAGIVRIGQSLQDADDRPSSSTQPTKP